MVPLEMLCEIVQHNTCMVPLEMLCLRLFVIAEYLYGSLRNVMFEIVPLEMLCLRLFSIIPVWFP